MNEKLLYAAFQVIPAFLALVVLVILSFKLLVKLRDFSKDSSATPQDLVANFEEMRLEGDLSDAEFRRIQSVLGKKQASETTDASPTR